VEYRILGPVDVLDDAQAIPVGGGRQRALLGVLLLHANETVSRDRLMDELWGAEPPETATTAIQVYVSQLRKALGRDAIETRPSGYALGAEEGAVDSARFAALVESAHGEPPELAAGLLREALAIWRGPPLADVDPSVARSERARLEEERLAALERRIDADLELGRHAELVSELDGVVREHPFREHLRAQLMLALYRSGRQADALDVYRQGRQLLDQELGLEPGEELRRLERAILEHEASIAGPVPRAEGRVPDAARRRRRVFMVAGAALLVAATAAVLVSRPWNGAAASPGTDDHVVALDRAGTVDRVTSVTGTPSSLASDGSALWVGEPGPRVLQRIDASSGEVTDRVPLPSPPGAIAVSGGAVWAASTIGGIVMRVNPTTDELVQTLSLGSAGAATIASGRNGLWASDSTDRTLVRIDTRTGGPDRKITLDFSPTALAVDRTLWVADYDAGTVSEIDPNTEGVLGSVGVGHGPVAVAVGAGSVWVATSLDGTVSRIDPSTRSVVATIPVGKGPSAVTVSGGIVWVANRYSGTVARINPATDAAAKLIPAGSRPAAVAEAADRVWVGAGASGAGHRGGTLVLSTTDTGWQSDPAVYERALTTQFTGLAYDTLVTFQHVDGPAGLQLVPDLAVAIPTPSDGGRTYTFRLLRGIRYSDGRVVQAGDFRRAFERLWRVRAHSSLPPGASRYVDIVGMGRCQKSPWDCNLSRGIVTDDAAATVVFHLKAPDPYFLSSLTSFAFSAPIPRGVGDPTFGVPVPGTGPYRVANESAEEIRFVRNPYFKEWSPAAQPDGYADAIVWKFARSHEAVVKAIEDGNADWTFDLIPPAQLKALGLRAPSQVHVNPWYLFEYIALNPHVAPFDDARVRRALNLAIDRRRIVRMYGGSDVADSSCQLLVPGLPGYQRYCPYTRDPSTSGIWKAPDLARARRLVAAAGTRGQLVDVFETTELAIPTPLPPYVASVLRSLGFRVRLHPPTDDITQERQLLVHGDWIPDYPEPSSFMQGFFSCHGAHNTDTYSYCDRALDRKMTLATSLQLIDPKRAAELWAEVDREIVDKAWWVPTVTPLGVDLVSSRVGNYRFHPLWGFMADQAWLR
jgi:YVTN family beta-propeller protein